MRSFTARTNRHTKQEFLLINLGFVCCFWSWIGTVWTASAHIITAVIGSGVLSLAWATAQLGWIAGPTVLFLFSFVTYYTSSLLAACYRSGNPDTGKRNYTYMEAVRSNLGNFLLLFKIIYRIILRNGLFQKVVNS